MNYLTKPLWKITNRIQKNKIYDYQICEAKLNIAHKNDWPNYSIYLKQC